MMDQSSANRHPGLRVFIGTDVTGTRSVPNGIGIHAVVTSGTTVAPLFQIAGPSNALKGTGCSLPMRRYRR